MCRQWSFGEQQPFVYTYPRSHDDGQPQRWSGIEILDQHEVTGHLAEDVRDEENHRSNVVVTARHVKTCLKTFNLGIAYICPVCCYNTVSLRELEQLGLGWTARFPIGPSAIDL